MLNHAQIEWLRVARDFGKSGFVARERRSLERLVSLGYLTRRGTAMPAQMDEWRLTSRGLAALVEAEREPTTPRTEQVPRLGKREQDLLCVAKFAGHGGFSMGGRSRVLRRLVSLGLVEEVADMPVSRWWRITVGGETVAKSYGL